MTDQTAQDNRIVGTYGFGKGTGDGVFFEKADPAKITPDLKGTILLMSEIPTVHFMFKASAVGIEALVVASNNLSRAEQVGLEIAGRAQIGFLVVSETEPLKNFQGKRIVVDGSKKILGA